MIAHFDGVLRNGDKFRTLFVHIQRRPSSSLAQCDQLLCQLKLLSVALPFFQQLNGLIWVLAVEEGIAEDVGTNRCSLSRRWQSPVVAPQIGD